LKYCFVVKLFEKWRISPPPQLLWQMAPHFGDSPRGRRQPLLVANLGGGGLAWVALSRAFPEHKEYSLLPRSPYLQDFSLMFLMLNSPLDTALLLVLLQPSGDGYFWLCSSKSSFRGISLQLHLSCRSQRQRGIMATWTL
jgi:hypothetical protein